MKHLKPIIIALMLASASAQAKAEIEIALGLPTYGLTESGIWWDAHRDHIVSQPRKAFSLGFTGNISPWLDWRLGYIDFGNLQVDSLGLSDDTRHERKSLSRFVSESHVSGLYASLKPFAEVGKINLFFEVGAIYFKPEFKVAMYDMPVGYHDNGEAFGNETVIGVHKPKKALRGYMGTGIEVDNFTFTVSYYSLDNKETDQYSTIYKDATTFMVGYKF